MAGIPGILNAIFGRQSPGMLGGGVGGYDPMLGGDPRFGGGAAMAQLPGSAPRGGFGGSGRIKFNSSILWNYYSAAVFRYPSVIGKNR